MKTKPTQQETYYQRPADSYSEQLSEEEIHPQPEWQGNDPQTLENLPRERMPKQPTNNS